MDEMSWDVNGSRRFSLPIFYSLTVPRAVASTDTHLCICHARFLLQQQKENLALQDPSTCNTGKAEDEDEQSRIKGASLFPTGKMSGSENKTNPMLSSPGNLESDRISSR